MTQVVRTKEELQQVVSAWKAEGARVAFVPTMGALHEGHLALVDLAVKKADRCVVSIFVNPSQFLPHEDFESYPRHPDGDTAKLAQAGADLVYLPSEQEVYGQGAVRDLEAGQAAMGLETDFRPGFFDGVVSVVSRLFAHVSPDVAVFGEKDYQQLCVIREMFSDMEIVGAPIVRDMHGLALSSRNAYLSPEERVVARMLNQVLFSLADQIREFPLEVSDLIPNGIQTLLDIGFHSVDYLELCTVDGLKPVMRWNQKPARLLVAAYIGETRLIDNVAV